MKELGKALSICQSATEKKSCNAKAINCTTIHLGNDYFIDSAERFIFLFAIALFIQRPKSLSKASIGSTSTARCIISRS